MCPAGCVAMRWRCARYCSIYSLTERESTVLEALVQGKRNKDIAGELCITERTVKYHVNALFTKLRVQNRTQAVRAAVEQGLVSF